MGRQHFIPIPNSKIPKQFQKKPISFKQKTLRCCAPREPNGYCGFPQTFPHLPNRNHSADFTKIQARSCCQQNFPWESGHHRGHPPALGRRHVLHVWVRAIPPQASASQSTGRGFSKNFQSHTRCIHSQTNHRAAGSSANTTEDWKGSLGLLCPAQPQRAAGRGKHGRMGCGFALLLRTSSAGSKSNYPSQ